MALDPLDPFAPPPLVGEQVDPWGWVPPQWLAPAVPAAPVQPGLGIPQATLDALPQPEIEMPAMDAAPQPAEIQMPAMDVGQPEIEMPALDVRTEQPAALQPGLGIPAATLDALPGEPEAVPAPTQEAQPEAVPLGQPEMPVEYQSPEERAGYRVNLEADRAALARKRQAEALLADERAANEERQVLLEAREAARRDMDQARQEAANLANEQPTSEDWYEQGGLGRTAFALIAAIGGGLVQHLNGGRNVGMEMIDKNIERFIRDRRANIAHRRAMLGDQMQTASAQLAQAVADQREDAAFRLAAFDRTMQAIQLEAQNYDPQGSKALAYADALDDIAARRAQAEAAEAERLAKLNEAQRKAYLEERKVLEDERHNRAAEKASQTSAYASLLNAKSGAKKTEAEIKAMEAENEPRSVDELRRLFPQAPAELFTGPMSLKQFKGNLDASYQASRTAKEGSEAAKAARENSPEERQRQLGLSDIVDKKGSPILFGDGETRRRISKKRGAVDNAARIIDQVLALRGKYGWSSDLFRSPEWQAAQSNAQSLFIELKTDAELGVLAGPDMEILDKMSGGDPTQVRDPAPALKQLRSNMVNNLNGVINAESPPGQKPKRYEPPKLEAVSAQERSFGQDLDVYNAPEIDAPDVPDEIRRRAAVRAAQGVDAMTRKMEPSAANIATLEVLLAKNEQRRDDGILDDETADMVAETIKKRRAAFIESLDAKSMTRTKDLTDKAFNLATPPGGRR